MLSVDEALRLVERHACALAPRRVPLGDAAGLMLAEEIVSEVNSPPYDKALMDGYAVISSDREDVREVIEEIGAGTVPRRPVTPGTVTRLMTGAPLPEGADAVVAFEQTESISDLKVRLLQTDPKPGQHVLPMGASLKVDDVVLRPGAMLRPIEIGILAEIGHGLVAVQPRPRVSVLPTGNELVPVGATPAAGQVRNSNGPMLTAALTRAGADAAELPIAPDDPSQLHQLLAEGLAADMLLICGGVSAGKFDLVPGALEKLGVEQVFHKVALRPGKPLWFGVKRFADRVVPVFGLPGNPVSSFVCFELFVRPALAVLAGGGFVAAPCVSAKLSHNFMHKGQRDSCLPARVWHDREAMVEILPWHGSADLATLSGANGLVRLAANAGELKTGACVDVLPL